MNTNRMTTAGNNIALKQAKVKPVNPLSDYADLDCILDRVRKEYLLSYAAQTTPSSGKDTSKGPRFTSRMAK